MSTIALVKHKETGGIWVLECAENISSKKFQEDIEYLYKNDDWEYNIFEGTVLTVERLRNG